jgi:hypothetical protein
VKARGRLVVGDAYLRAELAKRVECFDLRGTRIDGREHAQRTTGRDRSDAGTPNERHHEIDAVCRLDLGEHLIANARLTRRVREEGRVRERDQRLRDRLGAAVGEESAHGVEHSCRSDRTLGREGRRLRGADNEIDDLACECRRVLDPELVRLCGDGALDDAREMKGHAVGGFGTHEVTTLCG